MQLAHPNVAQPTPGWGDFQPHVCLSWPVPVSVKPNSKLMSWASTPVPLPRALVKKETLLLNWSSNSVSHNNTWLLWARPWNSHFSAYPILINRRGSCNPREIASTIWLLYFDQLNFHLLHNKYFWLLPWRYSRVRTQKARKVHELKYLAHSFVWLSKHTQSEWNNVLTHQLPRSCQQQHFELLRSRDMLAVN